MPEPRGDQHQRRVAVWKRPDHSGSSPNLAHQEKMLDRLTVTSPSDAAGQCAAPQQNPQPRSEGAAPFHAA